MLEFIENLLSTKIFPLFRARPKRSLEIPLKKPHVILRILDFRSDTGNVADHFFWLILVSFTVFAQSDAEFAKANQEYAQDNFKEAVVRLRNSCPLRPMERNRFLQSRQCLFSRRRFWTSDPEL